jgi:hypothetical protein
MIEGTAGAVGNLLPLASSEGLPRLLAKSIDQLGYQPFVAIGLEANGFIHTLLCPTQNEAARFVEELEARGIASRSTFAAGIAAALMRDGSRAVHAFSQWLAGRTEPLGVAVDLPTEATAGFVRCVGYPLFRLSEEWADDPTSRAAALSAMTSALARTPGNDLLRWTLCEVAALALAEYARLGHPPEPARDAVAAALTCLPDSGPLRAALGSLGTPQLATIFPETVSPEPVLAVVRRLRELPRQPLFTLAIVGAESEPDFLAALTNAELGDFTSRLRGCGAFPRSRFLRAYAAALDGEIYDAGTGWFEWATDAEDRFETRVETVDGYPLLYLIESADRSADPEVRADCLVRLLGSYEAQAVNEAARNDLLEGLALALSKYLGRGGRFAEALTYVQQVLRHVPRSIHLKAAENALERCLAGEPVPDRLVKFIDADNGALRPRICRLPFTRFAVGPQGDVHMCCGHWLPTPIGNIVNSSTDEVLNSEMAQRIRASMLDGTFKYCNHLECGAMVQDTLPHQNEVTEPTLRAALDEGKLTLDGVEDLHFGFDPTCNLSCPSCRTHRIADKPSESQAKADAVERTILPLLPSLKALCINPAGEFLASKPSRRLLESITPQTCPDLKIDIISNGTLFTEKEWEKFPNVHGAVRQVRISVDGCTKQTFETIRRLANFDVFCKNMTFLANLRAKGALPQLNFSFTYQMKNLREMCDFVFFARGFNCDFVIFERLQNLGTFTNEEYRANAVHLTDHPQHAEFLAMIRDPVFRQPWVWHEFEWEGTVDHHPIEAREAWHRAHSALLSSGRKDTSIGPELDENLIRRGSVQPDPFEQTEVPSGE